MSRSKGSGRAAMGPEKLVDFLEAVYAIELDDAAWLTGLMSAAREVWGRPAWCVAVCYEASDPENFREMSSQSNFPTELLKVFREAPALMSADFVRRSFRSLLAAPSRKVAQPDLDPMWGGITQLGMGVSDLLTINGLDPSGVGCMISLTMIDPRPPPAAEMAIYKRMALHIAAAYRCRRRLRELGPGDARPDLVTGAEAVLDPRGRVLDATGPAKERASQDELRAAVRRFDAARSRRRGSDPVEGLGAHRALVDSRWTLVDSYERGGARYVVARENQAAVRGLDALADRERQVAVYIALGRSTKEVAYALGISDSTVRVLLSRAASKLGVRSRAQLILRVTRLALPELAAAKRRG